VTRGGGDRGPALGLIEWLRPGEHARAEAICDDLDALGVRHLRTHVSWADWHTTEGQDWYAWLLPYLGRRVELLPCFMYTPPSLGLAPHTASPPRDPKAYADFLDLIITRFGDHFDWVELWNEPNNLLDWNWRLDPGWQCFAAMIRGAAHWARQRGKRTLLGGMAPIDPGWLDQIARLGALADIDAVGVHGFPETWDTDADTWPEHIDAIRAVLDRHGLDPAVWITEAGYSTWRYDESRQIDVLLSLLQAPAERVYWYSGHDLHPEVCHQAGFHQDERHYHFGLKTADGAPKLLYRLWAERGLAGVRRFQDRAERLAAPVHRRRPRPAEPRSGRRGTALVTGGCGFVGTNLAARLLADGRDVLVLDNLCRPGAEANLEWLAECAGGRPRVAIVDLRDVHLLRDAVARADSIFHLAAQVAVTTSLADPAADFGINAGGTLALLEAARCCGRRPRFIYTSTNKVYGALDDLALQRRGQRWEPADAALCARGIGEERPLQFCSPYGCSKGAADQYVLDFGRTYGLPTLVLRMSCIYGPHQNGNEDQGWVAHFMRRTLDREPVTLYGDGAQVRDLLYVDDLVDALLRAEAAAGDLPPAAYNLGGGADRAASLLEVLETFARLGLAPPAPAFADWRPGDQRWYVTDTRRFCRDTGWEPRYRLDQGLRLLAAWLAAGVRPPMGASDPGPLYRLGALT
jgi:CDP-paratose 2-epimerase